MRLFVTEYLSSGALAEQDPPQSLLREGLGMWRAVIADLAALGDVELLTTLDARLPVPRFKSSQRITVLTVETLFEAEDAFQRLAQQADAALVIAPEFDDLLASQCERLAAFGTRLINATPTTIRLCSDKLQLARFCEANGIRTIPTRLLEKDLPWDDCVIKPRDGAGSLGIQRVLSSDWDPQRFLSEGQIDPNWCIVQPMTPGRTLSVMALFDEGKPVTAFPVAEQHLSNEGRFRYLGGAIPAADVDSRRMGEFVLEVGASVQGLHGPIGFDLLLPDDSPDDPVLVEINPRLTTSYLGYREISKQNLARWLIAPGTSPTPTFSGRIQFTVET